MARVTPPTTSTWNVYIKAQVEASPDKSLAARRLIKRTIKLEKIAQVERLARGSNTATNFRSNNIYVSPGTRSPTPHSPWGSLTFAYQDDLSKNQTTFGLVDVDLIAWSTELGIFVAINNQYNKCATSPDSITWTIRPGYTASSGGMAMYAMIWTGDKFLAVGRLGYIMTSADGINWTQGRAGDLSLYEPLEMDLRSIAKRSGFNRFVAVGGDITSNNSNRRICVSTTDTTLTTWTRSTSFNSNQGAAGKAVVWGAGATVISIGTANNDPYCVISQDSGVNWTNYSGTGFDNTSFRAIFYSQPYDTPMSIDWNGTQFLAISTSFSDIRNRCATSPDGIVWTNRSVALNDALAGDTLRSMARLGTTYIVGGTNGRVVISTNGGVTWVRQSGSYSAFLYGNDIISITTSTLGGGQFIAGSTQGRIATSTTGTTWTYQDGLSLSQTQFGLDIINSVAWDGKKYLIIGSTGKCATSPDGKTWTLRTGLAPRFQYSNYTLPTHAVNWNGQQFLVVGGENNMARAATSPDGITWTVNPYGGGLNSVMSGGDNSRIAWHNNQYVVISGQANNQWSGATSSDGAFWNYASYGLGYGYYGNLVSDGTRLVTTFWNQGEYGIETAIVRSDTGSGWNNINPAALDFIPECCAWNGLYFMVTGGGNYPNYGCIISTDGDSWNPMPPLPFQPRLLKAFGRQFVILGTNGQVATSTDNGITWTVRAQSPQRPLSSATDLLFNTSTSNFISVGLNGEIWTAG